jgi:hypothetical protein
MEEELDMTVVSDELSPDIQGTDLGIVHVKVADADRANAFYGQLLDWQSQRFHEDGRTAHYVVNTSVLTVLTDNADAPPVRLFFPVDDVAEGVATVEALGGRVTDSAVDVDHGGWAEADDGQGVPIGLWRPGSSHYDAPAEARRAPRGEIGYLTIHVGDTERGTRFYSGLLGWRFEDARPNGYRHVVNAGPAMGLYGTEPGHQAVTLYVRVSDLVDVAARVPALGGRVTEPSESPSGLSAVCTDDQGLELYLWQPAPGY